MADPSEFDWRRSSLCAHADCAEVSGRDGYVLLRNSKKKADLLQFERSAWMEFVAAAREGAYDLPLPSRPVGKLATDH